MSYSFRASAATVAALVVKVAAELDRVAELQPSHQKDFEQAKAATRGFIDLLVDDPPRPAVEATEDSPAVPAYQGREVYAQVHGCISHLGDGVVQGASIGIQVGYESLR